MFHGLGDIVDVEGNFSFAEFGGVERLQVVVVERRMLLGEAEGFVRLAMTVDIAEVGLAVESVIAF